MVACDSTPSKKCSPTPHPTPTPQPHTPILLYKSVKKKIFLIGQVPTFLLDDCLALLPVKNVPLTPYSSPHPHLFTYTTLYCQVTQTSPASSNFKKKTSFALHLLCIHPYLLATVHNCLLQFFRNHICHFHSILLQFF